MDPLDARVEYQVAAGYHQSLVAGRTTSAALFVAGSGFLGKAVYDLPDPLKADPSLPILGLVLSLACSVMEARAKQVYTAVGERAADIEERHFRLGRGEGAFGVQYRSKRLKSAWNRVPSFTLAFRLLYWGSAALWASLLVRGIAS